MTNDQQTIDDYVRRFERHLSGPERAAARAELVAHLSDAVEAGDLSAALERLGTPEEAAAAFARLRDAEPAPLGRRWAAAVLDNLPLIAVTIALVVHGIARVIEHGSGFAVTFPPYVHLQIGGACISNNPFQCGNGGYDDAGLLSALGVPIALAWSVVGLGLFEALTGSTPGKRWLGLRVVTDTGLRLHPVTGIVRRLSLLAGPFAWLDWVPFLWGERRRILDRLTETRVVLPPGTG